MTSRFNSHTPRVHIVGTSDEATYATVTEARVVTAPHKRPPPGGQQGGALQQILYISITTIRTLG